MPQQAASAMDPERQDSCRALPACARLVAVSGAPRGAARMAVSKGLLKLRCSPVFPVLFPVCSQSGSMNSLRSQCSGFAAAIHMDAVVWLCQYLQPPGTLGTLGTGLKRHELGTARTWNRRGTLGTALLAAGMLRYRPGETLSNCHGLPDSFENVPSKTLRSSY